MNMTPKEHRAVAVRLTKRLTGWQCGHPASHVEAVVAPYQAGDRAEILSISCRMLNKRINGAYEAVRYWDGRIGLGTLSGDRLIYASAQRKRAHAEGDVLIRVRGPVENALTAAMREGGAE